MTKQAQNETLTKYAHKEQFSVRNDEKFQTQALISHHFPTQTQNQATQQRKALGFGSNHKRARINCYKLKRKQILTLGEQKEKQQRV